MKYLVILTIFIFFISFIGIGNIYAQYQQPPDWDVGYFYDENENWNVASDENKGYSLTLQTSQEEFSENEYIRIKSNMMFTGFEVHVMPVPNICPLHHHLKLGIDVSKISPSNDDSFHKSKQESQTICLTAHGTVRILFGDVVERDIYWKHGLEAGNYTLSSSWFDFVSVSLPIRIVENKTNINQDKPLEENLPLQRGVQRLQVMDNSGNNISSTPVNERVFFSYGVTNPNSTKNIIEIETIVEQAFGDDSSIFYEKFNELFEPKETKVISWSFVPQKAGIYNTKIIPKGQPFTEAGFRVDTSSNTSTQKQECGAMEAIDIPYSQKGVKINKICFDKDASSLIIPIDSSNDGSITIKVPRILLDPKLANCVDQSFFVLADGEEIKFDETKNDKFRILNLSINENEKEIEIVGSYWSAPSSFQTECSELIQHKFSPLKQLKYGISEKHVICADHLEKILKPNGSPACVDRDSLVKLIERGWAITQNPRDEYSGNPRLGDVSDFSYYTKP